MKIETFTNRILPINEILSQEFNNCQSFFIATAYIDENAIDYIEFLLRKSKHLREAKLLLGVFGSFNRKADLERLTELGKAFAVKFQVHISKNRNFHWKYYHYTSARKQSIYIGSANFTNGGMGTNAEILVKMSDNNSGENDGLNKLKDEFNREWEKSEQISEFPIQYYIENRVTYEGNNKFKGKVNDFFETKAKNQNIDIKSDKAVVVFLTVV
jgi:HKD family nuclease